MSARYHVFLSHHSADKPAVEHLAEKLLAEGIQPFLDKWNLVPGEPWQEGLEKALNESETCAVFLGPHGPGPWENEEMRVALDHRVRGRLLRVIPVLLPGTTMPRSAELPAFLSRLTWVDFRAGLNDADAFWRLRCGIRGEAPGPPLIRARSASSTAASPGATDPAVGSSSLRIFLCHASQDKAAVRALYERLAREGMRPWLDDAEILPGQDWEHEIRMAVRSSDVVVVCLSRTSIAKSGYVQKEIRLALDVADEQPDGVIFIVPLKLEECDVPERLRQLQWVNYYNDDGHDLLMRALSHRARTLLKHRPPTPANEDQPAMSLGQAQVRHQAAIELAEDALLAVRRGESSTASELFHRAYMTLLPSTPPGLMPDSTTLYITGRNRRGAYLTSPVSSVELAERSFANRLQSPPAGILADQSVVDPRRASYLDFERPWDLAVTGWGVVFAPDLDPSIRRQLDVLLEHRCRQASRIHSSYYRDDLTYREGESAFAFLARHGAKPGAIVNPDSLPYHLLLVGHPESLPYNVQSELDVSYAVGRIWFENPEGYAQYAQNVVRAEEQWRRRSREIAFFAPEHPNDSATRQTCRELVQPLAKLVVESPTRHVGADVAWQVRTLIGNQAIKQRLSALLGGPETPALLFAACHGLGLDWEDDRQTELQGALVCQDWPGPDDEQGVDEEQFFSATDLQEWTSSLHGLIAFLYASYGLGTRERDSFDHSTVGRPRQLATRALVSRLPQRLLSRGALAVIGQVDRAWTSSFDGFPHGEGLDAFLYALRRLLKGFTVGSAMELINHTYSALAAMQGNLEEAFRYKESIDRELWTRLWLLRNHARNFMVFGDPAVRLPGIGEPPL